MLPIPKNSRWNGLVYLHGLLPENADDSALNRLVLTSGDFGLAYLTERWAARFVSELFRNYVVCFVGYSINDPVLRYMMDALAADRMLGEVTPQAYALGDCEPGQEAQQDHRVGSQGRHADPLRGARRHHDHSALHRTLKAWAETYRDGILGKERIVVDYALARPSASTRQDDFVGRMLWALSARIRAARQTLRGIRSRAVAGLAGGVLRGSLPARRPWRFGVPPRARGGRQAAVQPDPPPRAVHARAVDGAGVAGGATDSHGTT